VQHRRALSISLLISAIAMIGAPAEAAVPYKLRPGAGAVVSFDLRGGNDRAALVRFPRNRAALVRAADRRLELRTRRRRPLLHIRPGRRVRVQVRFDLAGTREIAVKREKDQPDAYGHGRKLDEGTGADKSVEKPFSFQDSVPDSGV
jgi:hypothetical protein